MKATELPLRYPMDVGAPVPKILASERLLHLFYFTQQAPRGISYEIVERDATNDRGVGILEFNTVLSFKFGTPNDEALAGHPYYPIGLRRYAFFEIEGPDWLEELTQINSVHPYHDPSRFLSYHHYVLTFHDSTFECIAKSYTAGYSEKSMGALIAERVEQLIVAD